MTKHDVTYIGGGSRIISKSDWASIDIDAPGMTWTSLHPGHHPTIQVEDMSDAVMEYLTVTDKDDFRVKEVKEPKVEAPVEPATPADEAPADVAPADEPSEGDAEGSLGAPSSPSTTGRGSRSR